MEQIPVTSYVRYLHEVCRRISQRGGFDCIPTNKKGQPLPCSLSEDEAERQARFLAAARTVLKDGDRGLFVGFGLVAGKANFAVGGQTKQRKLLAPVLYAKADLLVPEGENDAPDERDSPGFEVMWDSLAVNIDLLTLLLTGSADYDPEEEDNYYTQRIPPHTLDALANIEDKVSRDSDSDRVRESLLSGDGIAVQYLREVLEKLPQSPAIEDADDLSLGDLIKRAGEDGLVVSPAAFLFFAPIPSQVSTTVALHKLRRECDGGKVQSELLANLLAGALEQSRVPNHVKDLNADSIEKAISRIPLSLSENQHRAVLDAWCHRLSYIQGPPGTGKSHTIATILLSAVWLKQRVLMVSHKPEAVAIVRRKVNELLGARGNETVIIEASPLPQNRAAVRQLIQRITTSAQQRTSVRNIRELTRQLKAVEQTAQQCAANLEDVMQSLQWELEQDKEFVDANELLLKERRAFADAFGIDENELRDLAPPPEPSGWGKWVDMARKVTTDAGTGGTTRLRNLSLKLFLATTVRRLRADPGRLSSGIGMGTIAYLEQLASLTESSANVAKRRYRHSPDNLRSLRNRATALKAQLQQAQESALMLTYQLNVDETMQNGKVRDAAEDYQKLLRYVNPRLVDEKLREIDMAAVTKAFPLWVGEMRHLGHFLPFQPELFDLIVVDEASQVNIAEIVPAIARGARLCVVGDTKQLGLESVGLFSLNPKFEELCWLRAFGGGDITLQDAERLALRVGKNAILDFVTSETRRMSVPKTVLDEHFRSVPKLAAFTSGQFYKDDGVAGGLRLMRETPADVQRPCFKFVHVKDGKRDGKTVPEEAQEVVRIMKHLMRGEDDELFAQPNEAIRLPSGVSTIGVLCFLTEQRNYIRELVADEFEKDELDAYRVLVGTTEEFQGNERQVMILTLGLDTATRYAKSFYENPKRFNVATSRATDFTFLVTSAVPFNADLLKQYLRHFHTKFETADLPNSDLHPTESDAFSPYWTYNPFSRESEFENRVDQYLQRFIADRREVQLYTQVEACGQKRLDFVLHNTTNNRCCAVEVDGRAHFVSGGRKYSDEHLARVDMLRRAGWNIVHVPYYEWYSGGWLCHDDNPTFMRYVRGFYDDLARVLNVGG